MTKSSSFLVNQRVKEGDGTSTRYVYESHSREQGASSRSIYGVSNFIALSDRGRPVPSGLISVNVDVERQVAADNASLSVS